MLKFPRFRPSPSESKDEPQAPAPPGATVILLVEDEPAVRGLFAASLRTAGYFVIEARNGAEGLEAAARADHVDLVVTDIVMPVMKGPQLAVKLREQHPDLRFLFVSGYLIDEHLGPNADMMQKPFKQNELVQKIADIIGPPHAPRAAATA